ncbi:MAG TPA: hypothetical protein VGE37_00190, partial [Archangium sp.]
GGTVMHRTLLLLAVAFTTGCAASRHVSLAEVRRTAPPLEQNHFFRDQTGLGEAELQTILASPVFLEEHARIGVLPVRSGYAPDEGLPVDVTPATLVTALEGSGMFDLASEIASEWPTSSGTAGLRELAARYRTEYVLLYRHRFDDQTHANGFAAGFFTLVGALFLPGTTIESSGVLEATLFDVKTGTILFTVHERVRREAMTLPLAVEGRIKDFHDEMTQEASKKLAAQVLLRCQRLISTRPANAAPVATRVPSS